MQVLFCRSHDQFELTPTLLIRSASEDSQTVQTCRDESDSNFRWTLRHEFVSVAHKLGPNLVLEVVTGSNYQIGDGVLSAAPTGGMCKH